MGLSGLGANFGHWVPRMQDGFSGVAGFGPLGPLRMMGGTPRRTGTMLWRGHKAWEWASVRASSCREGGPCGRPYIVIFVDTDQGSQFTGLEFTQVLQDRGVKISMDGKGRYAGNIFVERLWRTVKYEEVYLKAYVNAVEARRELGTYFRLYNNLRPHQALGYRTPAEVFHGEQGVGEESKDRRCSPGTGSVPMAGASGLSLNSALILSN